MANKQTADAPCVENRSKFRIWITKPFWEKIYNATSSRHFSGWNDAPVTQRTIHRWDYIKDEKAFNGKGYKVVTFVDDGHEIGIGEHDEWWTIMPRKEFNKIILGYMKIIVIHEWFGLRTWLYWYSFSKHMEESRKNRNSLEKTRDGK